MPIIGSILARVIEIRKNLPANPVKRNAKNQQRNSLLKLLKKAELTAFGKQYRFGEILTASDPMRAFQQIVPIFDYNKIYEEWWNRTMKGESDVCWPGKVKYFALSSGTSEAASKHIPITSAMLRSIKRTSVNQILSLARYEFPDDLLQKGFLMVGGSTSLLNQGSYFEGDLSGITAKNIPLWFQSFYKPGKIIAQEKDWNVKLEKITACARDWDIGIIVGVPAWIQIIMEKIIDRYKVKNIHEIWPNLSIFVHGGVSFEPYRKGFDSLLGKPLIYMETYLASEGFIAFQNRPDTKAMKLILNNGIFFEFVPFNEENFTPEGQLTEHPQVLWLDEVQEGKEYALLLSTNAGTWRYLIGDIIKFTSKSKNEIVITGRTKHFISLCGEHLSVDNMNNAIKHVSQKLDISIPEYAVAGIRKDSLFAHRWYIGTNQLVNAQTVAKELDDKLKEINDDYATERRHALKDLEVEIIPANLFNKWMELKGKMGGQHKFPRVLKNVMLKDWEEFLSRQHKIS